MLYCDLNQLNLISKQKDLQTSPAELTLSMTPMLPDDLLREEWPPMTKEALRDILEGLRVKSAQPPKQMTAHGEKQVHMPDSALQAEYVFVKKGKPGNLGKQFDGPFKVEEGVGNACLKIRVGSTAQGEPRYKTHHWNNMKPAVVQESTEIQERPNPGRKKRKEDSDEEINEPESPNNKERQQTIPETKENEKENTTGRPIRTKRQPIRYSA